MALVGALTSWRAKALGTALAFFVVGNPGAPGVDLPSCGAAFASAPTSCDSMGQGDTDGDGVRDCEDQCAGQSGPASNGGCPESWWQGILNFLAHAWTSVNTLMGYLYGMFSAAWTAATSKDRVTVSYSGQAMEFRGSALPLFPGDTEAMVLGATVHYNRNHEETCRLRAHEAEHVRQYRRWGVLYLVAYAGLTVIYGGYYDNPFERRAREAAAEAVCDD